MFRTITPVLGEYCPFLKFITRWYKQFKSGDFSVEDGQHSGRPAEAVSLKNVAAVQKFLNEDGHITYRQIQELLQISAISVYDILHKPLQIRKVCWLWVLHLLTDEQKHNGVEWCKKMLNL